MKVLDLGIFCRLWKY